jgi:hypothetical protein
VAAEDVAATEPVNLAGLNLHRAGQWPCQPFDHISLKTVWRMRQYDRPDDVPVSKIASTPTFVAFP